MSTRGKCRKRSLQLVSFRAVVHALAVARVREDDARAIGVPIGWSCIMMDVREWPVRNNHACWFFKAPIP